MRRLLLLFALTACVNPKEKIVEKQREIKGEMQRLDIKKSLLKHDEMVFIHDSIYSLTTKWHEKKPLNFVIVFQIFKLSKLVYRQFMTVWKLR